MPPKKKVSSQSSSSKELCCIWCQPVSIGKDEALFCAGACQKWVHRYCASVSERCYKAISESSTPFFCLGCYQERQQEHITELTNTVEDLRLEIARLKESLSAAQAEAKAKSDPPQRSYASVTDEGKTGYNGHRNGQHKPGRKRQRGCPGASRETQTSSEESATAAISAKEKGENKIRVIGARRVWGTLKSSNVKSVKSVIARVCKIGEVRVVRKDRLKPGTNKSMWWYVVHAKESVPSDLETK